MKRLLVTIKMNLLLKNIYKHTETLQLLQADLQKIQKQNTNKVIKNELGLIALSMPFGLNEITSNQCK
jgi:hypothetical protein